MCADLMNLRASINELEKAGIDYLHLDIMDGTAKRTHALAKEAGVTLTTAGATYPYGIDPDDSNIRIAPTYPSNDDLEVTMDILTLCAKIAAIEKFLGKKLCD